MPGALLPPGSYDNRFHFGDYDVSVRIPPLRNQSSSVIHVSRQYISNAHIAMYINTSSVRNVLWCLICINSNSIGFLYDKIIVTRLYTVFYFLLKLSNMYKLF